ncbi:MAG TPA: O-antigen ligase family protein, partial [Chloroflexia bacterium]|nr:O-antigen ligase family protein [Chloroflexia bacterium]
MAATTHATQAQAQTGPAFKVGLAALAVVAGLALGAAAGFGAPQTYLVAGLAAPFLLLLTLARPHWAVAIYAVLVYADLLSVLVQHHGMPPLARFAGAMLLSAVLGYRIIIRREGLVADKVTWWLAAYGGMVALGLVYARHADSVMVNVIEFGRIFLTYLIIVNAITTPARLRALLWGLLGAGVFLAMLTIFQTLTGQFDNDFGGLAKYRVSDIAEGSDAPRPGGTIGDANYYGQLLLVVLPIGLYLMFAGKSLAARIVGLAASACLVVAVVFTYSRGDALALGAIVVAAAIYKRPHPIFLVGAVVALMAALPLMPPGYVARLTTVLDVVQGNKQTIYTEDSIRGRAGATQAAIDMFLDHPLLGVGRENYASYQLEYISGTSLAKVAKGIPPHNLYLEVLAEHGLLGVLVVGGLLVAVWRALREARRRYLSQGNYQQAELAGWLGIALFGYLVSSMFLHGAFLYMLGLQIALIVALRQMSRATDVVPTIRVLPVQSDLASDAIYAPLPPDEDIDQRRTGKLAGVSRWAHALQSRITTGKLTPPDETDMPNETGTSDEAPAAQPVTEQRSTARELINIWLRAAAQARLRGDMERARELVDQVLEREPNNVIALQLDVRLRSSSLPPRHLNASMIYEWSGPIRSYWERHGGEAIFGQPISPPFTETMDDGHGVEVQYFEKARLEFRPECADVEFGVVPGRLG